ncbi:defensin Ec-AMP-D2-like [Malus sylvestris]|uniref:defensin Ec-AMP-D2 n=1 Tax=Malus domestica TaxID=3750 RepID=UPI0010AAEE2F|nr:defensin Ec-AMP-D2 [Malus domestica]XP_050131867.1 defensin Ec-AMP-D2-like [Malus sylvestris]
MERSMRLFPTVFVFLLLLVATGTMVAEGRTCESQSNRFKGSCVSKSNCAAVCQTEGFPGGNCRGLRRRCFCTKHC